MSASALPIRSGGQAFVARAENCGEAATTKNPPGEQQHQQQRIGQTLHTSG